MSALLSGVPGLLWSELVAPLRRRPRVVGQLALWSLVEAIPGFATGRLVAASVDSGFGVGRPMTGMGYLLLLGAAVFVGAWATRQVYPRLAALVEPLRDDLVRRVVTGGLHAGEAVPGRPDISGVARLTQQVEIVREAYAGITMVVRRFVFAVAGALLGVCFLEPLVLLVVLPPLVAATVLLALMVRRTTAAQRELLLADEDLAALAGTVIGGLRDVTAAGAEQWAGDRMEAAVRRQVRAAQRLAALMANRSLALAVGGWLPLVLLLTTAPWLSGHGVTAGALLGSVTYIMQGIQPALQTLVQGLSGSGVRLTVTLRRILESTPTVTVAAGGPLQSPVQSPGPRGESAFESGVELAKVTFAYGPGAEPVVRDLDLVIEAGDHLVVVGPSGIGKSTFAGLLSGLLRPTSGEVRFGGRPLPDLGAGLVHRRVLIPQEAYVFTGTLAENLAYLDPTATPGDVERAVAAMGLERLVERLGGYRATVSAGELSAGERQQIALARAYLSPAELVILDEATCHLDPVSEARAEEAFTRRPGSLVIIAHRMSSALRARRVLLMDGADTTVGSHEELLACSGLYRDLAGHWQRPAGAKAL
ncbi:ATP-binding cassette subfamily C protein [Kitasatospora sp. GP30]|uniref:ABC transporter ATP-binding protein n=1 Tax=Kitasatospora sp. GP30 TaxID=3035084 RepID=UPI002475624D|nr:ABC transporter ATP-binding protein [Kitasatospora sp. GP30]MDH6145565.1 ATP-binding cassette subfamily C protein [Kitasatospora sp. GP30]